MKRKVLIGVTLFMCLIALSVHSNPADDVLEKEFQESFQVNENAKLIVQNKYGDIFLTTWDKNEIKIDVIVKIEFESNRSKITKYFDDIKIEISGNENLVEAITQLPSYSWSGNLQLNIDYYVSLPASIKLDIKQKYGSVILNNDWTGETTFNVSYGNIQARNLSNRNNSIDVKYGELNAENIEAARIDVAYSEASIKNATKLDLNTSYGDVELGVIGSLDLKTAFDDIEIKEITDLYARSNYSDLKIDKVKNSLDIDMDFGEITIDYVLKGFKSIKIDSDNAGVEIGMDESASYRYEVLTRYGDFYIRNEKTMSKEKLSFNSYKYTGTVGSSANAGELIVDSSYASIEIK